MPEVGKPANVNVQNVYAGKVSSDPLLLLAAHGLQSMVAPQAENCTAYVCSGALQQRDRQTAVADCCQCPVAYTWSCQQRLCAVTHPPASPTTCLPLPPAPLTAPSRSCKALMPPCCPTQPLPRPWVSQTPQGLLRREELLPTAASCCREEAEAAADPAAAAASATMCGRRKTRRQRSGLLPRDVPLQRTQLFLAAGMLVLPDLGASTVSTGRVFRVISGDQI